MRSYPIALLALAVVSPTFTGCASNNALRMSIDERDNEIRRLREEKATLKDELQRVAYDREQLQVALSEASSSLEALPREAAVVDDQPAPLSFSDLEEVGISAERRGNDVVFSIPSAVTFGSGRATLSDGGRKALASLANRLKSDFQGAASFYIEGHTDSDPISRSKFDSNRALSIARAMAVLDHLVVEGRIEDDRFVVVGFGQYEPVASNDSAEGKARNRRVEIVVRE
ncbi:MAG: OmpA family protein [bacterium]|nr:OmpA family protein [bacterium]